MKKYLNIKQWAFKNRIKPLPKKLYVFNTKSASDDFAEKFLRRLKEEKGEK